MGDYSRVFGEACRHMCYWIQTLLRQAWQLICPTAASRGTIGQYYIKTCDGAQLVTCNMKLKCGGVEGGCYNKSS